MKPKKRDLINSRLLLSMTLLLSACGDGGANSTLNSGDPRVIWENSPVPIVSAEKDSGSSSALTLTATIIPPYGPDGVTPLYADDIYVTGATTYVAYNVPGAVQMGAIDALNMSNPSQPTRPSTQTFYGDINGIFAGGSALYAVGASNYSTTQGAILYQMNTTGIAISTAQATLSLPSYAGTGATLWGGSLYVISGDTGGLTILNPASLGSGSASVTTSLTDIRGLDWKGSSSLWAVAGGGNVYQINAAGSVLRTVTITGANAIAQSKSTIQVGSQAVAVSLGNSGAAIICQADGRVIGQVAAPTVIGISSTQTVTNAVTFANGYMFTANGVAGVSVYSVTGSLIPNGSACTPITLTLQGTLNLGTTYSANNVKYVNGNLYVATGAGGFKVITVNVSLLGSLVAGLLGLVNL